MAVGRSGPPYPESGKRKAESGRLLTPAMHTKTFAAIYQKDEAGWSALCPELDVASQGATLEEAQANLREAVELLFDAASPAELERRLKTETLLTQLEVNIG
jgi:predicted RNase H-like HicB family nuclease